MNKTIIVLPETTPHTQLKQFKKAMSKKEELLLTNIGITVYRVEGDVLYMIEEKKKKIGKVNKELSFNNWLIINRDGLKLRWLNHLWWWLILAAMMISLTIMSVYR